MSIVRKKYSEAIIERIKQKLLLNLQQGQPKDYDIKVDDMTVVDRTNLLKVFDSFRDFVTANSKSITIRLYKNNSRHNEAYFLFFNEADHQEELLNGTEFQKKLNEALAAEKQRRELHEFRDKNDRLKKDLKDAEKYIEELEEIVEDFKSRKFHMGNVNLGEVGSVLLEGFVRRNPQIIAKLPGGEALAGIIAQDNAERIREQEEPVQEAQEIEASYQFKEEDNNKKKGKWERKTMRLLNEIFRIYGKEYAIQVTDVMESLAKDRDLIIRVHHLINKKQGGNYEQFQD